MKTGLIIFLVGWCLAATPNRAFGADEPDRWEILHQVRQNREYMLVDRDLHCYSGKIARVTAQSVAIQDGKKPPVTIERKDLLRLGEFLTPASVIYSGRSSWADVQKLPHHPPHDAVDVRVVTHEGKEYSGKLIATSDTGLTVSAGHQKVDISKPVVSQVFYLRYKPMSPGTEYAYDESFVFQVFDPALWPYLLGAAPKIAVRLYDSSQPEENSPIVCSHESQ
jgi:hypothetical protein